MRSILFERVGRQDPTAGPRPTSPPARGSRGHVKSIRSRGPRQLLRSSASASRSPLGCRHRPSFSRESRSARPTSWPWASLAAGERFKRTDQVNSPERAWPAPPELCERFALASGLSASSILFERVRRRDPLDDPGPASPPARGSRGRIKSIRLRGPRQLLRSSCERFALASRWSTGSILFERVGRQDPTAGPRPASPPARGSTRTIRLRGPGQLLRSSCERFALASRLSMGSILRSARPTGPPKASLAFGERFSQVKRSRRRRRS